MDWFLYDNEADHIPSSFTWSTFEYLDSDVLD